MFKDFKIAVEKQVAKLLANHKYLFETKTIKDKLWDTYINSFPENTDPKTEKQALFFDKAEQRTISVEATVHTCKACRSFIRQYGNLVGIVNGKLESIWDIDPNDDKVDSYYKKVAKELSKYVKSKPIVDVFVAPENNLGTESSLVKSDDGTIIKYNHFSCKVPDYIVTPYWESVERLKGKYRATKQVFQRGLNEIPVETLELVIDLIDQGSLLNGDAQKPIVILFKLLVEEYNELPESQKDLWVWNMVATKRKDSVLSFRNTLIGTLCTELAEGKDINEACKAWNIRVDPVNYHKAKSPITRKQVKMAEKFVKENGYEKSFDRRLATINDIKVSEIFHINRDKSEKSISIFDNINIPSTRHKRSTFKDVQEVSIEKFMKDILPRCTSVEAFITNKYSGNLVNITTSKHPDSKSIFKWDNNYSFTFNGNLAGKSEIKETVKSFGGKVDGVLRFSIMWAGDDGDNSDLDAHCKPPIGNEIYFSEDYNYKVLGRLDVDITHPKGKKAVENIIFSNKSRLVDGEYKFFIRQYAERNSKGFRAEIEFDDQIYQYYGGPIPNKHDVYIATVKVKNGKFSIEHHCNHEEQTQELWGLETNNFHKVNLISVTPNYWGNNCVGHKHYLFMLEGCKNPNPVRGFHNEHLIPELLKHRKVMDVLGNATLIEPTDDQLAGLGFNATVRNELIVRLKGNFNRVIKIKF